MNDPLRYAEFSEGPPPDDGAPALTDGDIAAIDAFFGDDRAAADPRRAEAVRALLGLLEPAGPAPFRPGLVDVTLAAIVRQRRRFALAEPDLSPADSDALEALIGAGYDPSRLPRALRPRAERLMALLRLVPGELDEDAELVGRTMSRIDGAVDDRRARMMLPPVEPPAALGGRWRFRVADLVSAAAMLLIAASVVLPVAAAVRETGRRMACASDMSAAGLGFDLYARDHRDQLPLASEARAGLPWWDVGQDPSRSNSANLFMLVRTGHAGLNELACPGNPFAVESRQALRPDAMDWAAIDQVSFSFQNLFSPARPDWNGRLRIVVLTDRSPVIPRAIRGQVINPYENSPNHGGRGQGALFNDGSVVWLTSPVLPGGDNIFLPRWIEGVIARLQDPGNATLLKGTESPDGADDVFVVP